MNTSIQIQQAYNILCIICVSRCHIYPMCLLWPWNSRQCRQLVQRCSGLTVDQKPFRSHRESSVWWCPIGGVPLNKTIITQWPGISPCSIYPVYRILGLNVMKCYDCSSWPTQWSLQGIIHVRRCEAAKALQERFPTRGQTTARGDVLSAPVVQGCLLSFWGKKLYFSRVFSPDVWKYFLKDAFSPDFPWRPKFQNDMSEIS